MRRFLIPTLITTLCFSLPTTSAAAASAKAGAACSKVNQQVKVDGQTLKCVKSGKKLVWKATSSSITKPPTPTPTASPTPTTKLNSPCARYLEIDSENGLICQYQNWNLIWLKRAPSLTADALRAYNSIASAKQSADSVSSLIDFYQSPNFSADKAAKIKSSLLDAVGFWSKDYPTRNKLPVVFFTEVDRPWYKSTLETIGLDFELVDFALDAFDKSVSKSGSKVSNAGSGIGTRTKSFRINTYLFGTRSEDGVGFTQVAAHEWTHNAQNFLGTGSEFPCWFREGQASYYGLSISATSLENFTEMRRESFWSNADISINKAPAGGWSAWLDQRLLANYPSNCGPDGIYVVGGLLTEFMVSLKGHQGIVDYSKAIKSEPWDKALLIVYGLTWDELKKQFLVYLDAEAAAFGRG